MKVLKFGGTSLGTAERIKNAAHIVSKSGTCMVVCSAMAGMTNSLLDIYYLRLRGENTQAKEAMVKLKSIFDNHSGELLQSSLAEKKFSEVFERAFAQINRAFSLTEKGGLLALGEQLTSLMMQLYLVEMSVDAVLLDAPGFLHVNEDREPNVDDIATRLQQQGIRKDLLPPGRVVVTQGFICTDHLGQISTLSRGGSDFTATLLGSALKADCIEIWTDIDGMHNNDPRYVQGTTPIKELSFTEAAELAYFGAKILHPSCVKPAREAQVPILIKNTFQQDAPGTLIRTDASAMGIRAIAAKENISILRISSGRMFNVYGFLASVFDIFQKHKTAVDVVTTSEVSVSVTIEDDSRIDALLDDLSQLGRVNVESERCIVCIVGDILQPGHIASIMQLVKGLDVRMISLGASSNNITLVFPHQQKSNALNALHSLFSTHLQNSLKTCTTTT